MERITQRRSGQEKTDHDGRTLRRAGCERTSEFLATVSEFLGDALKGEKGPKALCYVCDAQVHTLRLERAAPVEKLAVQGKGARRGMLVERAYEDLLEIDLVSASKATGKRFRVHDGGWYKGPAARCAGSDSVSAKLVVSGGVELAAGVDVARESSPLV
jgi:hypothetical protein